MSLQENEGKRADEDNQNTALLFHCYIHRKIEEFPEKISQQDFVGVKFRSFERFCEIYSELLPKPKKGEKLYKVLIEQSKKTMLSEIEDINKDLLIEEKLRNKNAIVSEYSDKKGTIQWRPDGNVEKTLVSHSMEVKLQVLQSLQEKVEQNKKSVAKLKEIVDKNCLEINKIKNSVNETKIEEMYDQEVEIGKKLWTLAEEYNDSFCD